MESEIIKKDIASGIEFINSIIQDSEYTISCSNEEFNGIKGNLNKELDRGYLFSFQKSEYSFLFPNISKASLVKDNQVLISDDIEITNFRNENLIAKVYSFYSEEFNNSKSLYLRLLIPVKDKLPFIHYFQTTGYKTKDILNVEFIPIKINSLDFHLYQYCEKGENYAIIDCVSKISFEEFKNYYFSILVSYSFITGYFPMNEQYIVSYENEEMAKPNGVYFNSRVRETIKSFYSPINKNAYAYLHFLPEEAERINPSLQTLSMHQFQILCNKVFFIPELSSAILLTLESSGSTLLLMPSGYCVVLEAISSIIENDESFKKSTKILKNPLARDIRSALCQVVNDFESKIIAELGEKRGQECIQIFKHKIEKVNNTTNQDKIVNALAVLKIPYYPHDFKAISHRNDFFHGRIHLKPIKISNLEDRGTLNVIEHFNRLAKDDKEVYFTSLKLYTLISALILKYIGYDGKIINYPKLYEDVFKLKLDEDYYRQI